MLEKELEKLYQKIASKVDDIIPGEWNRVVLGADIDQYGSGGVYFFFDMPNEEGKYIYNADIKEKFNVDSEAYRKINNELFFLVRDLHGVFIEFNQEPWFMLAMDFNNKGKLKVNYEYINWYEGGFSPGAVVNFFRRKYLGYEFESTRVLNMLEEMDEYAERLALFEKIKRSLVENAASTIKDYLGDFGYKNIVFNGQRNAGLDGIDFYIKTEQSKSKYIVMDDVIKIKESSSEEAIQLKKELYGIVQKIGSLYEDYGRDIWFSIMISYDDEMGIDWEFTYSNWSELGFGKEDIVNYFKYIYLDEMNLDDKTKKIILSMKEREDNI